MECRRLNGEDAIQYRKLRLTALQTDADAFSTDFTEASEKPLSATVSNLENPSSVSFGAFSEGELIGMMTLSRLSGKKTSHRAEVLAVYVRKESRGGNAATALFDYGLRFARNWQGLEQLELAVNAANGRAIRFYERLGFERLGLMPHAQKAEGRYLDELLMRLPLENH